MLEKFLLGSVLPKIYVKGEVSKTEKGPTVTINNTNYNSYTIQLNMDGVDEAKVVVISEEHKVMLFYLGVLLEYTFDPLYNNIIKRILAIRDEEKGELDRGTFGRYLLKNECPQ